MKLDSIKPLLEHRKVITLHPNATTAQAARVMCERGTGSVIVSDGAGRILGLVTDRDLACHALQQPGAEKVPISSVMTENLITLDENATPEMVVRTMERHGIRRVPILQKISGERVRCIGIITLDDLIGSEAVSIHEIAPVVRRQMIRRAARSDSHRQQTLRTFYKQMSYAIGLPEETSEKITHHILRTLVRRLSFSGASHLLSQLPATLQEELISLEPGPDRSVTVSSLLNDLITTFSLGESQARSVMIKAFAGITESLEPGEIEHVKSQLPEEFRALFVGPEQARSKLSVA